MLISAIMITGKNPLRNDLASVAVRCFHEQSYGQKELVIINDSGTPLLKNKHPLVKEICLQKNTLITLGELRNVGLENASGDLVIQWDDDDWHHPKRIEIQASCWKTGAAVLLDHQIRYSFHHQKSLLFRKQRGIEGTILHERLIKHRYPSIRRREDTIFLKYFREIRTAEYFEPLYIRFFHQANTWGASHIMLGQQNSLIRDECKLSEPQLTLLQRVLTEYYPFRT